MANPFKAMAELYNNTVDEIDKAGYADLYKSIFLKIQSYLQEQFHLTMEDIEYRNGYFIFGSGTNSVIHFKFKGAKQWQFGLWWGVIEKENMKPKLQAQIFCQHKRHIDKFKPSRSDYCQTVDFIVQDDKTVRDDEFNQYNYYLQKIGRMCKFVHDHPYLAWDKDWHGYDYNIVKQRPIRAFCLYYADGFQTWWREAVENFLNCLALRKLKKYAHQQFDNTQYKWEISDAGDCTSPRYELQVEVPDGDEQETGCFGLFETDEEDAAWRAYQKKLEKLGTNLGIGYWYSDVADCITFWNQKELDAYWAKEEAEEEAEE